MSYRPESNEHAAGKVLVVLHYSYPIILLFFFLFAFSAHSIATSRATNSEDSKLAVQYGPGGKPLPVRSKSFRKVLPKDFSRSRKLVFQWLTVAVCFTFVGNAIVVIWHALYNRHEHWWCGQAVTVNSLLFLSSDLKSNKYHRSILSARSSPTRYS